MKTNFGSIPRAAAAAIASLAIAGALAGPASASSLHGTVVDRNTSNHTFVVASRGGALHAVHAARMPAVGRIVRMGARARHDGTFTAGRVHQRGRTRHARVHGTVSFVDRRRSAFVVSGHGASIVVGAPQQPLPAVGKDVVADVDLGGDDDDVEASHVQEVGEDHGLEIEGTITAIDAAARKLTVTADDEDELQGTLTVTVPATIDIAQFKVGDEVELKVALQPDGSYLLTKAETEDDEQGDDDDEDHGGQGGDGGDD